MDNNTDTVVTTILVIHEIPGVFIATRAPRAAHSPANRARVVRDWIHNKRGTESRLSAIVRKGFPKGFPFEEKKICQDQSLIKFNKWKREKNSKTRILIARNQIRINQTSYNNHVENWKNKYVSINLEIL